MEILSNEEEIRRARENVYFVPNYKLSRHLPPECIGAFDTTNELVYFVRDFDKMSKAEQAYIKNNLS